MEKIKNRQIIIDGFNLIITVETALAGGIVFCCRDGYAGDIAGVYGSYHMVDEAAIKAKESYVCLNSQEINQEGDKYKTLT